MKHQTLRSVVKTLALALLIAGLTPQSARAADKWISIRTKNFTLVGNAGEKDIRLIANRLEEFHTIFASLFPATQLNSAAPTTVIIFKSDRAFKPYKVKQEEAGYFQPGEDVNYIALTSEGMSDAQPARIIFHEYVHLLMNNMMGATVPLWFNEGLAEYYSTFDTIKEERRVLLGQLIPGHLFSLREHELLPLRTLFAVDYKSPYYNEGNKMNIFYAESWMFMHYLLQTDKEKHRPQLTKFVDLLRSGMKLDDAFQQAFQSSVDAVEKDFKNYVQASRFMTTGVTFEHDFDDSSEMELASLSEADAHAYLGDLLLHTQRMPQAEAELRQALALDPESVLGHTAFGMMRLRQARTDEARSHLEKALKGNPGSYLLHYYYAFALSGLKLEAHSYITDYAADVAATMRSELNKAIALKPDYADSYWLFGFVNLVRNEQIDETIDTLKKGLALTSTNHRVLFMLAQLYMRKESFAEARELLTPVAQTSPDSDLREQAAALIKAITRGEETRAAIQEELKQQKPVGRSDERSRRPMTAGPIDDKYNSALADALRSPRAGEKRVQGLLTEIDCNGKGITFQVRAGERLLKYHSENLEHLSITAFTTGVGREIGCGPRKSENWIVLTYLPPNAGIKSDGEVRAIEFVPPGFVLKP
jgi:tetratricopeptide (TPR) repeat protein